MTNSFNSVFVFVPSNIRPHLLWRSIVTSVFSISYQLFISLRIKYQPKGAKTIRYSPTWRMWTFPPETCSTGGCWGLSSLSGWTGHDVRPVQCPFFPLVSFCPLLLDWKHVQLSHHSVSATISLSPRLKKKKKKAKGAARKSGLPSSLRTYVKNVSVLR